MIHVEPQLCEPGEQIERWAAEGRPDRILAAMREMPVSEFYLGDWIKLVSKALANAAEKGVAELIEVAFREMLKLAVDLLMRAQYEVYDHLRDQDNRPKRPGTHGYPMDEPCLARIERLHHHIVTLSKAYASIRHTLDLASRPKTNARGSTEPKKAARSSKGQEKSLNGRERTA